MGYNSRIARIECAIKNRGNQYIFEFFSGSSATFNKLDALNEMINNKNNIKKISAHSASNECEFLIFLNILLQL